MVVTLEVSKLSGWLKADACCRVERRAFDAGGREVRAGRREGLWCGGGTQAACTWMWPDSRLGGMRGAHLEHEAHGRDAGGVEAQRLVEGRRGLPSRRERAHAMRGGEVRAGRRERGHGAAATACTLGARLKAWGPRARAERTSNIWLMVVTLEVSKLSGWLKADADCRVKGRACNAGKERCEPGGGRACGVWWRHGKRHARGKGPTQGLIGGQGHARSAR